MPGYLVQELNVSTVSVQSIRESIESAVTVNHGVLTTIGKKIE